MRGVGVWIDVDVEGKNKGMADVEEGKDTKAIAGRIEGGACAEANCNCIERTSPGCACA